jgi:hypothetical protein
MDAKTVTKNFISGHVLVFALFGDEFLCFLFCWKNDVF